MSTALAHLLKDSPYSSKAWRLCNIYTILDADGKLVKFQPNIAQRHYYNEKHYNDIILKARKMGFSTLIEIDHLDDLLFGENLTAGIIDYTLDDAKFKLGMMKLAYSNLDNPDIHTAEQCRIGAAIKRAVTIFTDSTQELVWSNGSRARCSTSLRGATPQRLHLSELGKTSIWAPIKAKEILNGAFNALTPGNSIKSESTHEGGKMGMHYNLLKKAMAKVGQPLTEVDLKFHFFPWYQDPRYILHGPDIQIRPEILKYFHNLAQTTGQTFTHAQMLWFDRKQENQGHGMKKEFPSSPGEAFEAISDHAIYGKQMADLRAAGRIIDFNPENNYPIFTSWDLGLSDYTSIWLVQPVGRAILILDWYECSGENASSHADQMRRWEDKWNRAITCHFLPHDANTRDKGTGKSFINILHEAGLTNTRVVPRTPDTWLGIGYVRDILPHCWFHKTNCDSSRMQDNEELPSGVACLEGYQRDVSASGSTLREMPKHDLFSHSADGFRTFAEAWRRGLVESAASPPSRPRAVGHTPRARR